MTELANKTIMECDLSLLEDKCGALTKAVETWKSKSKEIGMEVDVTKSSEYLKNVQIARVIYFSWAIISVFLNHPGPENKALRRSQLVDVQTKMSAALFIPAKALASVVTAQYRNGLRLM